MLYYNQSLHLYKKLSFYKKTYFLMLLIILSYYHYISSCIFWIGILDSFFLTISKYINIVILAVV